MLLLPRLLLALALTSVLLSAADDAPQFTNKGEMLRPDNYREWIYLSSGLGMTYGPLGQSDHLMFDNVFVNPSAYRAFLKTGTWPDKTVMILEVRGAQSNGSINHGGHFQTGEMGVEAHVKDSSLPNKWAFFAFNDGKTKAKAIPRSANCYSCHQDKGAVDTTFVQFYPTIIDVARKNHTFSEAHAPGTAE